MGALILSVVVGLFAYVLLKDMDMGRELIAFLVGVACLLVLFLIGYIVPTTPVKDEVVEISALKDGHVTEGSFFLGTGNIDGEAYYYYMKNTEKGKKMERVLVSSSYINEEKGLLEPKVDIYEKMYSNDFLSWLYDGLDLEEDGKYEYIFYVPEGTVTTDFVVDME